MSALRTAVCSFEVDLWLPAKQAERRFARMRRNSKAGPGKHLAIGAVADVHAFRVDFGFVSNSTAVAGTLDSHRQLLTKNVMDG